jgi:hypothetical protein
MRKMIAAAGILLIGLAGCDVCCDSDCCGTDCCVDYDPPAVPTGVSSITADGYVIVVWNPVYQSDLAGYGVYRSYVDEGPYVRIGDVAADEATEFTDYDVVNGITYYYAVDAYDYSGNESDLSYETVDDTPRPEGWNLKWYRQGFNASLSAIAILPEQYDELVLLPADSPFAQYSLSYDGLCLRVYPHRDAYGMLHLIQDFGYTYSIDDVDTAPTEGWSTGCDGLEVIAGHTYVLRTSTGYYGKFRVVSTGPDWIVIDWAYQVQRGSVELQPRRPAGDLTRG